jgi:hypothetical protein
MDPDDDVPWASPEARSAFEAALGRFMLAFNELDHTLTDILERVVARIGQEHLREKVRQANNFWSKVLILEQVRVSKEGRAVEHVSTTDIREVSGLRNSLAHAHYDENPFDGSYSLVNQRRKGKREQQLVRTAAQIDAITARVERLRHDLRQSQAYLDFVGVPLPDEPGGGPQA